MKVRKNLSLEARAIAAGERAALRHGAGSLSAFIEKQLLATEREKDDGHFSRHTGKPVSRPGDARQSYLKSKHA